MKITLMTTGLVAAAALAGLTGCTPDDGSADFAAGKAAFELRDLRKAERLFTKSHDAVATNVDTVVYLARVKLALGELAAAKDWVAKADALDGDATDVRMLAAQIAWHAKDYTTATKGFLGLADDPKLDAETRSQALAGLGLVEMTCNNRDAARIAFLKAIRTDRRNAAAWYHLGLLYRDSFGYSEAALEQFNIFVRLESAASPRVQKVQRALIPELKDSIARSAAARPGASRRNAAASAAALAAAEEAWKKMNFKTAKEKYQAAFAADPLSYPAAFGLARAWQKTDSSKAGLNKALEAYKQACVLRPGAVSTYLTTGDLCVRLGLNAQAVEIYSRAVAANPTSLEALDGLIRTLRKTGAKEKAQAARLYQTYRDSLAQKKK